MADQATIDQVKLQLPTWAAELASWDDTKIGVVLDANSESVPRVVWLFWLQRVADLSALTDVSDAGGARPLSQTYQHAMEQMRYWDAIAGNNATTVSKIKRRYHHRHPAYGLSDYQGVYGRVD